MKRSFVSGIALCGIILLTGFVFTQHQLIRDSYIVRTFKQQPASDAVMQQIDLTEKGMFIYKASRPQIQDADLFSVSCKDVSHEHSIVLGCYTQQRVYVYDVKDERLNGVKQVTAAHELLHAVYERLPESQRKELSTLLVGTANSIEDQRFKDTIAEYKQAEPGQLENELHSILGTEISVLPEKLEQHYKKYFINRKKIVQFAKQYEHTFTELDTNIKEYDSKLKAIKAEKDLLDASLSKQQKEIEQMNAALDKLRTEDPSAYNQQIPGYNAKIRSYNADITRSKELVLNFNEIVEKRNALATTQNDLVKQLDSNYQPLD